MSENVNRWAGFSDEELYMIADHLAAGILSTQVSQKSKERARLLDEINAEQNQREAKRASYRGPGRYSHYSGDIYEVLGKTLVDPQYEQVILRQSTDAPGQLFAEMAADFERRYTYLGPLEGS